MLLLEGQPASASGNVAFGSSTSGAALVTGALRFLEILVVNTSSDELGDMVVNNH
jgi:hypothetical protein